jgi:ubiquinone/menaquinone biosynthesis C-methylase UbiE
MDYDATDIPESYDRGRDHGPEVRRLWMNALSSNLRDRAVQTILDLGCGTGRFTEDLAVRFDAEVVGIDPSRKMLEQAKRKRKHSRVRYQMGRAEEIPLKNNCVDLIFISMVFHHFDNPTLAVRECRRVLRHAGTAFLRAGTQERISAYPYVQFFPESVPLLKECLATGAAIREVFESAGFRAVVSDVVMQEIAPNYALYAEKLSAGADSILARLSPRAFEAGMIALRSHAARTENLAVVEPIDLFVFR